MTVIQVQNMHAYLPSDWMRTKRELVDAIQVFQEEPNLHQLEYLRTKVAVLRDLFDRSMILIHTVFEQHTSSRMTSRKLLALSMSETLMFITGAVSGVIAISEAEYENKSFLFTPVFGACLVASQILSKLKDVVVIRAMDEERNFRLSSESMAFLLREEQFLSTFERTLLMRQISDEYVTVPWDEKRRLLLHLAERNHSDFVAVDLGRSTEDLPLLA